MRGPTSRQVFLVVIVACLLLLQLLSGSVVSALTTPHINRIIRSINSSAHHNLVSRTQPFPTNNAKRSPYYNNNDAILLSSRQMSSSSTIASTSNNGKLSFNPHSTTTTTPKQLISILLCNMTRHFTNLRRSVIRATVIVSLILLGYTKGTTAPIANAAYWGKSNNPDVVLVDTTATTAPKNKKSSSFGKKLTKLLVTAGAVSVGLSIVPNNGHGHGGNNGNGVEGEEDDGVLRVVPKDKPSPLPLPKVVVVDEQTTKPKPSPSNNTNNGISKDPILVKNLDSKIEMLRQREEQSKQAAETKRLADMATAEEARKVEQSNIDARISAEAERVRVEEEKKRQREEKLSELEAGKKEQWRLEQIKKEQQQQVSSVGGEEEVAVEQKQTKPQQPEQPRPLRIMTGSSGAPAKTKEEDLELTTQIILDYVNSQEDTEGVVDDDDDDE